MSAGLFSQEDSGALQVAQLLSGVNEQLSHLGLALLLVAIAVADRGRSFSDGWSPAPPSAP